MAIDKRFWHKTMFPDLNVPGCCERCGTFYQTERAKQKDPELCTDCLPIVKAQDATFVQKARV